MRKRKIFEFEHRTKHPHKFRERTKELSTLSVTLRDFEGRSFQEVYQDEIKKGEFDVPFHYYIDRDGAIHEGRKECMIASTDLPLHDTAIHVYVDAPTFGGTTKEQRAAIKEIQRYYKGLEMSIESYLW